MSAVMSHRVADSCTRMETRSVDELDSAIGRLVRQMNADSYRMLVLVREFDDRFGWKKWTFRSCAEWLAWRASISLSAAREKVRAALALRALPAIATAFADGRLSYSKVRAPTRVAHASDEHLLLAYALDATVSQVEGRGVLRLMVEVPIEEGEAILRALDYAVAAGDVSTGVDPDAVAEAKGTAWCAQQADALVAVAKAYLDGGDGQGGTTADHYQVVVHADATALTGGSGRADLPRATLERLLCDCSMVTVGEDASGEPLDVGRKQRTVSTPLRRALFARDRGCTFPGCHRKRYLDGHHVRHWLHGGETSAANMTLLCTHHHRALHEGGFGVVREEGGSLRFVTADGRSIPQGGYRLEDFVDDDIDGADVASSPSREGFCTTRVQQDGPRGDVREPRAVYAVVRRGNVHASKLAAQAAL